MPRVHTQFIFIFKKTYIHLFMCVYIAYFSFPSNLLVIVVAQYHFYFTL